MRNDHLWLLDSLDAIAKVEKYTVQGQQACEHNELIHVWVISHLQRIGKPSRTLSSIAQGCRPHVP